MTAQIATAIIALVAFVALAIGIYRTVRRPSGHSGGGHAGSGRHTGGDELL